MRDTARSSRLAGVVRQLSLTAATFICAQALAPRAAQGQIFVGIQYTGNLGTVAEYNASGSSITSTLLADQDFPSPALVSGSSLYVAHGFSTIGEYTLGSTAGSISSSNSSFITGFADVAGLAESGSDLFVLDVSAGTIGEYNATTGAAINASLVSGLGGDDVSGIAIAGSELFVTNYAYGKIAEYTLGSAAGTIASSNPSLISGLTTPYAIAASGNNLFITSGATTNILGEYTTSGGVVNASLATGLTNAYAIAISGSNLYVANDTTTGTIGQYTLGNTAGTISSSNASLISGLYKPIAIALPAGTPPGTSSATTATFSSVSSGSTVDALAGDINGDSGINNVSGKLLYTITDDVSVFDSITLPSAGIGPVDVYVDDVDLGTFSAGQQIVFADYASELGDLLVDDPGVQSFQIDGLAGLGNFPLQIAFNDSSASFSVTAPAVPEPAAFGLFCAASLLPRRRSSRRLCSP